MGGARRITSAANYRPLNGRSRLAIPGMLLTSPIRPFYPISQPLQTLQQNRGNNGIRAPSMDGPPPCKSFFQRFGVEDRLLPSIRPVVQLSGGWP